MRSGSSQRRQPVRASDDQNDRISQMTDKSSEATTQKTARRMAAALAVTGVIHLVRPQIYDSLIPSALPGSARAWSVGSGYAELAVAGLLAVPATRKAGGVAAAALFVGVWPGNLKMAKDSVRQSVPRQIIAWGRVPLQIPMIRSAVRVARG